MFDPPSSTLMSAKAPLVIGFFALDVLLGVVGTWSVQAKLSGAVIATGMVELAGHRQVVQHPLGGVVEALLVSNGDYVEAGDTLIKLEDRQERADLNILTDQLQGLLAQKARLRAENDLASEIQFPAELQSMDAIWGERQLFHARKAALSHEQSQIDIQIMRTREQIVGAKAQFTANQDELLLVETELKIARTLADQGLLPATRVLALGREQARLAGTAGHLTATIASLHRDVAQLNMEKLRRDSGFRKDAMTALQELDRRESDLRERVENIRETLHQRQVRAPVSGVIHGSRIFARRSVILAAEPILYIVPQGAPLIVSARINTRDVDHLFPDQVVRLKFPAWDQATTPDVQGTVLRVSADAFTDETTGQKFFTLDISLTPSALETLNERALLPGMPVEAYITTTARTPLSYLLAPLTRSFERAFQTP